MPLDNGNFVLAAIGLSDAEEELEINPSVGSYPGFTPGNPLEIDSTQKPQDVRPQPLPHQVCPVVI
jgi:hypothetical protein